MVHSASKQNHLVYILDSKLDFLEHIDNKINKCHKIIGLMKRRLLALSRKISLTMYNKNYPLLMLNDTKVQFGTNQKHLVDILHSRLDGIELIYNKINKWNKIICMMKRRLLALSRKILLKI